MSRTTVGNVISSSYSECFHDSCYILIVLVFTDYLMQVKDVENYDIRVIQLVRDPRPLLRSRSRGGFGSIDGIHKLNDKSEVNACVNSVLAFTVRCRHEMQESKTRKCI